MNSRAVKDAQVVFLSVKPRNVPEVIGEIGHMLTENMLLISVVAGLSTRILSRFVKARLIRAMPNISIADGHGVTAISKGPRATEQDMEFACKIFSIVGSCYIVDEQYMNAITALSGSGPAYLALIIEALWEAGILIGLPSDLSWKLAVDVVKSGASILNSKRPWDVVSDVATPGGVTISGIKYAEEKGLKGILMGMIEAAYRRSLEVQSIVEKDIEESLKNNG